MAFNENSLLDAYLKDVNKYPLLTHDETLQLVKEAKNGSKKAKDTIVNSNLRFVINIAKKYQGQGLELMDLISEGNIGLITALEHYDEDRGYHFISYAVWWIRQSIMKAIGERGRAIRVPLNRANDIVRIQKAQKMLSAKYNLQDEIKEIADMVGLSQELVADLITVSKDVISLEMPIAGDDSSSAVGDMVEDKNYSPEEALMQDGLKDSVDNVLQSLSNTEAKVLRYRFGLGGDEPMSLQEIGNRIGLTKERIRQIEKGSLIKLRGPRYYAAFDGYAA